MSFREGVPDTEFSEPFVDGMRDRMAISFFKYGPLHDAYPKKVDAIATALDHITEYHLTGNLEKLMDAANYLMIETLAPRHPRAHYTPTDSEGSLGRRDARTGKPSQAPNSDVGVDPTTLRMRGR